MLLVRLIRFLRGTVTFLISGAFPEKLLNRLTRARIPVWDASPASDGFCADAYASSYRKISRLARETGTRTRLVKKRGLPFVYLRHRKRYGLLIGVIIACFLWWYLATHLWVISITGCQTIDESTIYEMLAEYGVSIGTATRSIDPWTVEHRLLLCDDRIAWVTVNLRGSTAEIVLSECVAPPETIDPSDRYANVVAAEDGQICVLELYTGQALVKVGDTVSAGDVIVSGITDDQYGNARLKYARAKVIANVYHETTVTVPFSETIIAESKEPVIERELALFGHRILYADRETAARTALRTETTTKGILYPLFLVRETACYVPEEILVTRTPFEAKEEAIRRLRVLQSEQGIESINILSEELTADEADDALTLHSVAYVQKDIARIIEFSVS
jgi:similar to stage IV sporulation protein